MDTFRVRLNCVDHYQAIPTRFDPQLYRGQLSQQKNELKVPVIRVFGATETGQRVCAHIHGAFPYLYIEYQGSLTLDDVNEYIYSLRLSIDHALATSFRRNIYDGKTAFVAHITLVKGIPFYGYHVGYRYFFKIYMLNPQHMTRLSDLLRDGAVMKQKFQPYESHIQYLAQWMCDYNLYGCAYVNCTRVMFRSPVPNFLEIDDSVHLWHSRSIPSEYISDEVRLPRQSHCSIEVDVCVQDILNRHEVEERALHHDFIERVKPIDPDEKLVHSMAGLWTDETRRRKMRMGISDPDTSPFPTDILLPLSAGARCSQPGGWIHEKEYAERVRNITLEEFESCENKAAVQFETFVRPHPIEGRVQTALESVEDLYPGRLATIGFDGQLSQEASSISHDGQDQIDADFGNTSGFSGDEEVLDSNSDLGITDPESKITSDQPQGETPLDSDFLDEASAEIINACPDGGSEGSLRSNTGALGLTELSDLGALGIRKAGDFSHIEEDAFEIPSAYRSDVRKSTERYNKGQQAAYQDGEERRKKRRIIQDDSLSQFYIHSRPMSRHGVCDTDSVTHMFFNGDVSGISHAFPDAEMLPATNSAVSSLHSIQEGSQSSIGNTGLGKPRSLGFPVVKTPSDPNTILRLSQQSSSQKDHSKSFDQQWRPSRPSSHHDSSVLKAQSSEIPAKSSFDTTSSKCNYNVTALSIAESFPNPENETVFQFLVPPPPFAEVDSNFWTDGVPSSIDQYAYYGCDEDVPNHRREYAGREFKMDSSSVPYLPPFDPTGTSAATYGGKIPILVDRAAEEKISQKRRQACGLQVWEITAMPPTSAEVLSWLDEQLSGKSPMPTTKQRHRRALLSHIEGPTQKNRHGFKYSQKQSSTSVQHETQYMSLMGLEVHVNTRGSLAPNPEVDEVSCIFWCIQSDGEDLECNVSAERMHVGILILSESGNAAESISRATGVEVEAEGSELDLITRLVDIVRRLDPDILTGYEVHNSSWGYLIERARHKFDLNLSNELSRTVSQSHGRFGKEADRWGFDHTSTIWITGRHTINIWRAMRGELNLLQYTMENVVFHLLHRRIPHYRHRDLTTWYKGGVPRNLARVFEYYISRVKMDLEILESNELIPRTSEQARLLGIDFFSVISRGSQFKVESLMFRIAKPENLILISPSPSQVGSQNALECLPLVMEPQSDFYPSPLLVLDFQSLYPSVMIAYNYCYSTFLGRVVSWRGQNKMGFTDYKREPRLLELLKDQINIAPNGMMYTKPRIRKSLLAKMLCEILDTRVMVKSGMNEDKDDKTLQRLLNNRQLALKLIANVTYGYTSASFSGRMPCSEIADSIVQTGRETLEKAISVIHSVKQWRAEVVYGDTDSLFVYLKGRTREEAFNIGKNIADTITEMNPRPVKLKFEKVYHPCVLLAKKRYVGYKYEHRDQTKPEFDAKGIETVRRDGTPAEQKIEEKALKILFETADLSQVKSYFQRQCSKIMNGKVSIQDFCFAREVKLGTYSDKGRPPPGALISARRMLEDPRTEPQYGERVPYVVITGAPGARLIDRCVAPDVLLHDPQSNLDAEYYISKNIIPPLERIFNLVGANVRQWYDEMPKVQRVRRVQGGSLAAMGKEVSLSKKTMEFYMKSSSCIVCRNKLDAELPICRSCLNQPHGPLLSLKSRLVKAEKKVIDLEKICRSCSNLAWRDEVKCDSQDCPVFYSRIRQKAKLSNETATLEPVIQTLESTGQAFDW